MRDNHGQQSIASQTHPHKVIFANNPVMYLGVPGANSNAKSEYHLDEHGHFALQEFQR